MELLNENISHDDLKKYIRELYNYIAKELNIDVPPRIFLRRDKENANDIFGKTGGYDPDNQEIHLYITDRHAKDVLRSLAHELIHHHQKLDGFNDGLNIDLIHQDPAYAQHDEGLREMERQAFEEGNMLFRAWTDGKKTERKKIMTEKLDEKKGKMPSEKTIKNIKKSVKASNKNMGKEKVKGAAFAIAQNIKKGLKPKGPGKRMAEKKLDVESQNIKLAQEQALSDAKHRRGEDLREMPANGEACERLEEQVKHPYPQLFEEKPRLLGDAFNKKEELVYQELIRRFIKK